MKKRRRWEPAAVGVAAFGVTQVGLVGVGLARVGLVAVALAVAALGVGPTGLAAQAPTAAETAAAAARAEGPPATVEDLSWLAGRWRGEGPGGSLNETWIMPPRGGVMTGAMRLTVDGRLAVQEMITIAGSDGGVEMLLLHFDGRLVAQEAEPIVLRLIEWGSRRAVFEGAYGESTLRTTAEVRPGGGWSGRTVITRPDGGTQVIESVFEPVDRSGSPADRSGEEVPATGGEARVSGGEPAEEARVIDTSYRTGDGMRVLRQEVVVPASPETIWPLFSTAEGFASWAVPHAWIDFRVGGTIETSYEAEAEEGHPHNIRSRILSYVPERMLSIQAVQAPPGFPAPEILDELFTVIELEPSADGGTRVVVSGLGYRDGEPYETLEEFFRRGNAWTLEQLHERVHIHDPQPGGSTLGK